MKRDFIIVAFLMLSLVFPAHLYASGLIPFGCSMVDGQPVLNFSYNNIAFKFDRKVKMTQPAETAIYSGDEIMAHATIKAVVYQDEKDDLAKVVSHVNISMTEPMLLPKGKDYWTVIPADVLCDENNPDLTNDELRIHFYIPRAVTIDDNAFYELPDGIDFCYYCVGFAFNEEIENVEGTYFIFMREGKVLRNYPSDASWDWGIGSAYLDFSLTTDPWSYDIRFEEGIEYTVILSEGSVHARLRHDITNDEIIHTFFGGYKDEVERLCFERCSLDDCTDMDVLGKVRFYYDREIEVTPGSKIRLSITSSDGFAEIEIPALAVEEDGVWALEADFGDLSLNPDCVYEIIIPEATVIPSMDYELIINL